MNIEVNICVPTTLTAFMISVGPHVLQTILALLSPAQRGKISIQNLYEGQTPFLSARSLHLLVNIIDEFLL